MKKLLFTFFALASFLNALSINESEVSIYATGYKLAKKVAVPMVFGDTYVKFGKKEGSAVEILEGSTAVIQLNSIDTKKNPIRNKVLREKLFAHFKGAEVKAKIIKADGDDTKGSLVVNIKLNGVEQDVPMNYEVLEDKINAKGVIDLKKDFDAAEAFEFFATDKHVQNLHAKQSYSDVEIGFEVKLH